MPDRLHILYNNGRTSDVEQSTIASIASIKTVQIDFCYFQYPWVTIRPKTWTTWNNLSITGLTHDIKL